MIKESRLEREMYYDEAAQEYRPIPTRVTVVSSQKHVFYVHKLIGSKVKRGHYWQITEKESGHSLGVYTYTKADALMWLQENADIMAPQISGIIRRVMDARGRVEVSHHL